MVQPIPSSILSGIANPPTVAGISDAFQIGRDRRTARQGRERIEEERRLTGLILSKTLGGRLGAAGQDLSKLAPGTALNIAQALGIPVTEKQRLQSMMGDIQVAATIFESAGPEAAAKFAAEKASLLSGRDIRPTQYLEMIQGLTSDDPALVQEAGASLITLRDAFQAQGLLPAPAVAKTVAETRKEVRGDLRRQLKEIGSQTSAIQTNFNKIKGLAGEISKGNRNASAAALIALVKLGDPTSVVRQNEMVASLNNPNPVAAVIAFLQGEGISEDVSKAVVAAIDPLAPGVIDVNDLLATANTLVGANVPVIQASYAESVEQGEENLSTRGFKSVFTRRLKERVGNLSSLLTSDGVGKPELEEEKPVKDLTDSQLQAELLRLRDAADITPTQNATFRRLQSEVAGGG